MISALLIGGATHCLREPGSLLGATPPGNPTGSQICGQHAVVHARRKRALDFSLRFTVAEAARRYRYRCGRIVELELCGKPALCCSHRDVLEHAPQMADVKGCWACGGWGAFCLVQKTSMSLYRGGIWGASVLYLNVLSLQQV